MSNNKFKVAVVGSNYILVISIINQFMFSYKNKR